jgi:putative N6-adenine-specific DNA methylase
VLVQLSHSPYRSEDDLYAAASAVAWEVWFTPRQSFKVEVTAQHSPLKSLNFAALKIKDAVADRFRHKAGVRPDVNTQWPDVRVYAHLGADELTLYIDTSGEPLFKRGWREDKGEAPLKETLAAAMLAASGWDRDCEDGVPLYDPCCGSGTIAIEAAQIACNIAPGSLRRFAFEKMLPFQAHVWAALREEALSAQRPPVAPVFGSDVAHRMVDFAAAQCPACRRRGGGATARRRCTAAHAALRPAGVMLVNPPYGERIAAGRRGGGASALPAPVWQAVAHVADWARPRPATLAGANRPKRMKARTSSAQLATHWKKHYPGWTAWVLTPDLKLPGRDAAQGVAPRADVEWPHRVPPVPI